MSMGGITRDNHDGEFIYTDSPSSTIENKDKTKELQKEIEKE